MKNKVVRPLRNLKWECANCGIRFAVYSPSKLGDNNPCTECDNGTTTVQSCTMAELESI
jgi:hypothetical protein